MDLASVDELLTTTRSVRRRLDLSRPVPAEVLSECLTLALQAPNGSNRQDWRWIAVYDAERKAALADLYRAGFGGGHDAGTDLMSALQTSARFLVQNLDKVPVLVVPCIGPATSPAGWAPSIYPAVWSLMLALRSRGLGSCITTGHLRNERAAAELLGIPDGIAQACLLPVGYFTGESFSPAARRPVDEVAVLDHWAGPSIGPRGAAASAPPTGP